MRHIDAKVWISFGKDKGHDEGADDANSVNRNTDCQRHQGCDVESQRAYPCHDEKTSHTCLGFWTVGLFRVFHKVLEKEGQGQTSHRPTESRKVTFPVVGNHIGNIEQNRHVGKHNHDVQKGIFLITVGKDSLDHPAIDQNQ